MKITIDFSPNLSYSGKAAFSERARKLFEDRDAAREVMRHIVAGHDEFVVKGTKITRNRPHGKMVK